MPFSAQGRVFCKKFVGVIFSIIIFAFSFASFISPAYAQTTNYNIPNTDANVPANQHYFAQSVLIEMSSAIVCQLVGIDPINPKTPCLGIDPATNKLGFANTPETNGAPQIGGILGFMSNTFGVFYQEPASTGTYLNYLSDNFGIVKKAEAATGSCGNGGTNGAGNPNGYGFCSLQPLIKFWTASRDLAYFVFVIAFMLIGLGIMLRIKIDPRTVMTIQNQIPRIIVCVILITFSYALAALMIDAMWLITYIGINELATISGDQGLASVVTPNLLYTPIGFADKIFAYNVNPAPLGGHGILPLTFDISAAVGGVIQGIASQVFGLNPNNTNCSIIPLNWQGCLNGTFYWITTIVMLVIVFVILIMTLFRLWFELLKAYTFALVMVIVSPLWIVMGLLPGKPLGFEKWMRAMFVNLATFPAVALMIMLAKVFLDIYSANGNANPNTNFIPPLVGDPNMKDFGVLIAFGLLLMTPTMLTMLREVMKVPANKHTAAIGAGLTAGAAVPGAIAGRAVANLNKRDMHGNAVGPLAQLTDTAVNKGLHAVRGIPVLKNLASRNDWLKQKGTGNFIGYKSDWQQRAAYDKKTDRKESQPFDEVGYQQWKRKGGYKEYQKQQQLDDLHEKKQVLEGGGPLARYRANKADQKINRIIERNQRSKKPLNLKDPRGNNNQGGSDQPGGGPVGGTPATPPNQPKPGAGGAGAATQSSTSQTSASKPTPAEDLRKMTEDQLKELQQKGSDMIRDMIAQVKFGKSGFRLDRDQIIDRDKFLSQNIGNNPSWANLKPIQMKPNERQEFFAKYEEIQKKLQEEQEQKEKGGNKPS